MLGVDEDARTVQSLAGRPTHVVEADTTNEESLRQLSIKEFDRVVVGIGSDLEASILTASIVVNLGVLHIWAKAISHSHARVRLRYGVTIVGVKQAGEDFTHATPQAIVREGDLIIESGPGPDVERFAEQA